MAIRILLVDDQTMLREGLRSLMSNDADFNVVGEAGNGHEAVALASELKPDIVVMDVTMPELNGVDATRQILEQCPEMKVIGLSERDDRQTIAEMLKAGASGYLLKSAPYAELGKAMRAVIESHAYLSPEVAGEVIHDYVNQGESSSPGYADLTPREREVLQLLAEGHGPKDVGEKLHISVKTVHTHRQHIMEKLALDNLADLTKFAIREGITPLDESSP